MIKPTILVVAAMKEEARGYLDTCKKYSDYPPTYPGDYTIAERYDGIKVLVMVCGIGKVTAVANVAKRLAEPRFKAVKSIVSIGTAGGLKFDRPGRSNVFPGDVVIMYETTSHDFDLRELKEPFGFENLGRTFKIGVNAFCCMPKLGIRFDEADRSFTVLNEPIISGDRFVGKKDDALLKVYFKEAYVVDMETSALS